MADIAGSIGEKAAGKAKFGTDVVVPDIFYAKFPWCRRLLMKRVKKNVRPEIPIDHVSPQPHGDICVYDERVTCQRSTF